MNLSLLWPGYAIRIYFDRKRGFKPIISKVKLPIWVFFNICAGTSISAVSTIPEKMRLYQNVTGIDDFQLLNIFQQSLKGMVYQKCSSQKIGVNLYFLEWKSINSSIWKFFSNFPLQRNRTWRRCSSSCLDNWRSQRGCCCKRRRFSLHESRILSFRCSIESWWKGWKSRNYNCS